MQFGDGIDRPDVDEEDCHFILGHGHAGTHFIYDILTKYINRTYVKHQPGYGHFDFEVYDVSEGKDYFDISPLDEDELLYKVRKFCPYRPIIIDPFFYYRLYEVFPDANYYWLYRNGKDYVRGCLTHLINDDRGIPQGPLCDTTFEWACHRWNVIIRKAKKVEEQTEMLHIPFEDLVNGNCVDVLQNITPQLESYNTSPSNPTPDWKKERIGPYKEWSNEKQDYFDDVCGEMMDYLGYD